MSMSKQDFIALADAIRGEGLTEPQIAVLVRFCKGQNYAFKEDRWRQYLAGECGPNGGAIKKGK